MDYISFAAGKKVYIWGAWHIGQLVEEKMTDAGVCVIAYVDGKYTEAERQYNGKPLLSISAMQDLSEDKEVLIVVACAEHREIKEALAKNCFVEGINFLYIGSSIEVSSGVRYYEDFYRDSFISRSDISKYTVGLEGKITIGENVHIGENVKIVSWGFSEIEIGDGTSIGDNTRIECRDNSRLVIGRNVNVEGNNSIKALKKSSIFFGDHDKIAKNGEILTETGGRIAVDERSVINSKSKIWIGNGSSFECGKDCMISYDVKIRGESGHTIFDLDEKKVHKTRKNVSIEDHVWIGMGVSLLGGTVIGRDSIVGADSLVQKEFEPNSLIAGVPAKVISKNVNWDKAPNISYEDWEKTDAFKERQVLQTES